MIKEMVFSLWNSFKTHIGNSSAHHTKYTDAEVNALIAIHTAISGAHHAKYTDAEVNALIAIHTVISAAHHAKYTDAEAVSAMGAKADDNPLHHDKTAGGGASLTIAETEIFNGASPTSWTDLDLSGTIGANNALVLLRFESESDMNALSVRKDGDTTEYYNAAVEASAYGCALGHHDSTAALVLWVAASSAGKIEWKTETSQTATVTIIGYIK